MRPSPESTSDRMRRVALIGAAVRKGDSAWGRAMFHRRGGLAMATHGRHILLATLKAGRDKQRAAKLAAGCLLLALVVSGCAGEAPMDRVARPGLAEVCYRWTQADTKLLLGCRQELTTRPAQVQQTPAK